MDLRSLWRRVSGTGASADGAASGAGHAGSAAATRTAQAGSRSERPAWRDLPPIARTVQPAPLVARTIPFSHELSGHQAPPLALETLGHELRADAPAGIVTNLVTPHHGPIEATPRSGALRASVRAPGAGSDGGRSHDSAPVAGPPRLAGSAPNGLAAAARTGSGPPAMAPVPRPVVARSAAAAATSASNALVSATGAVRSPAIGVIGRAQAAGTAASRQESATPVAAPSTLAASGAVATPGHDSSGVPSAGPSDDSDPSSGLPRRNLGQTRRLRVGAPLDTLSLDPHLARRPLGDGQGAAADRSVQPPLPAVRGAGAAATPSSAIAAGSATGLASSKLDGATPTVARSVGDAGPASRATAPSPGPASLAAVAHPVPSRRVEPARPAVTVPLVGRLAVGTPSRSRRGATPSSPASSSAPATMGGRRSSASDAGPARPPVSAVLAALAAGTGAMPSTSSGGGADVPPASSRSIGAPDGPFGAARPSGAALQAGAPVVARSVAAGADAGVGLTRSAAAGAPSPLRRVASIGAPIDRSSLPSFAPVRPAADSAPRSVAGARTVQASRADEPGSAGAAPPPSMSSEAAAGHDEAETFEAFGFAGMIQRTADGAPTALPARSLEAGAPTVSREDAGGATGGAAGAAGAGGDDKALDELARKLFPRMQLRLRNELLIDRERIGTLADLGR